MPSFVVITREDFNYLTKNLSEDAEKIIGTKKDQKKKKQKQIQKKSESDSTLSDYE